MKCAKICQKRHLIYSSEITDFVLRISFKESGVKFTRWRFSPLAARPKTGSVDSDSDEPAGEPMRLGPVHA